MATAGLLAALPAGARSTSAAVSSPGAVSAKAASWTARPPAVVASRDAQGAPTFLWAATNQSIAPAIAATPTLRAKWFLARHARTLGLSPAALAVAEVTSVHDLGVGGTLVAFGQRIGDVPVFHTELKVLLDRTGRLVAIGGNLNHDASPGALAKGGAGWKLDASAALAAVLTDVTGVSIAASDLALSPRSDKGVARFRLAAGGAAAKSLALADDATVRRVAFPLGKHLVAAYMVETLAQGGKAGRDADAWRLVVAADDGRVLYRQDLTQSDSFSYRVWADPTDKHPLDGPQTDFSPHPTGVPDGSKPSFIPPNLVTMESFNHPPGGAVDPWLPAGATETSGNNVDAYTDDNDPDGFSPGDIRATVTGTGIFDRVYDTLLGPLVNTTQEQASITHLFYITNYLHDWWYDSGFDEAARNAQKLNYGRGGVEGDPLHGEAQDQARATANVGPARDNANMSTFSDGTSPRMQMYLWSASLLVDEVSIPSLALTPDHIDAAFGPTDFDVTADAVVVAGSATIPTDDGCNAIAADLTGKIALITRGTCSFALKAQNAQNAHAVGVVILNNDSAPPGALGQASPPIDIAIPTVMLLKPEADNVRTAALAGPLSIHMRQQAGVERDGSLDTGIVAHEWGHYLHHRLSTCDSTQQCGAMSEGWADFVTLHEEVREGDSLTGTFVVGAYATAALGDYGYFGIRRYPYSTDMSKNPLTFHNISDGVPMPDPSVAPRNGSGGSQSEVHNAGEIWAAMMFEAYMGLVAESRGPSARYTFEEAKRRMGNYVVAGMQLCPVDCTYTEQRDSLLAAAAAADKQDFVVLAEAFARRGAGTGAVSPPRDSTTLDGVVESFVVKADHSFGDAALAEAATSCDDDGVLDAGESGTLTLHVVSSGVYPLEGSKLTVSSPTDGVSFPDGDTVDVPMLQPFEAVDIPVKVRLFAPFVGPGQVELDYKLENAAAATPMVTGSTVVRADYDNKPMSSATDDVESDLTVWTAKVDVGNVPVETWSRAAITVLDHAWHGLDAGEKSDVSLVSPEVTVGTGDFKVSFKHHYSFEADDTTDWDGGVIEISIDGADFVDVASLPTPPAPGYNGTLSTEAENPLGGRLAYAATNPSYPAYDPVTLDFGSALAGKKVKLRFRIGSDLNAGAEGWFIDDIAFAGITSTPFATVVPNTCMHGPHADAGADKNVAPGASVTLDGSASSDADGLPLTYAWTQTGGDAVTLSGADSAKPTFTAPAATEVTMLEFQLTVSDGAASDTDTVVVLVDPMATNGEDDGGGCGCVVGARSGRGTAGTLPLVLLLGAGAAFVFTRRRR